MNIKTNKRCQKKIPFIRNKGNRSRLYPCLLYIALLLIFSYPLVTKGQSNSNQGAQYIIGPENKLEIVVHIWGEINRPGKYNVRDDTNLLELISVAGGPTEYSNLHNIQLTRANFSGNDSSQHRSVKPSSERNSISERVIRIDINEYLKHPDQISLPILKPGDVVKVSRNKWYTFQTIIRVISQVAIIAQAWYYWSLSEH